MAHNCRNLILHCIDFRLQKSIKKYLEDNNLLGDCDLVSVAGAVKNLNFVQDQIGISAKLHNIRKVILMNHTDCGAYQELKFGSPQEERDFHIREMKKAKDAIRAKYPDLEVKMLLAKVLASGAVELEEIGA